METLDNGNGLKWLLGFITEQNQSNTLASSFLFSDRFAITLESLGTKVSAETWINFSRSLQIFETVVWPIFNLYFSKI